MMRRMYFFTKILTLLLLLRLIPQQAALAQGLSAWLKAPMQMNQTIQSATGKTTITINAQVTVPEAEREPVYRIQPRQYNMNEIHAMAKAAFGQEAWAGDPDFQKQHVQIGTTSTFEHDNISLTLSAMRTIPTGRVAQPLPISQLLVHMTVLPDGRLIDAAAHFDVQQVVGEGFYFTNMQARPIQGQPKGTAMAFEEAKKLADDAVAAFAPGRTLAGAAYLADETIEAGVLLSGASGREGYDLYYTLALELPLTYAYGAINQSDFMNASQSELITVVVDDRGIRSLWFDWPHEVLGVVQEDAQLLPFAKVMEIAGKLLHLKYTAYEQTYFQVQAQVNDIRLGYMRVPLKDNPSAFQLVPVWDFFGEVALINAHDNQRTIRRDWANNSLMTINALDGTVIDREYGY